MSEVSWGTAAIIAVGLVVAILVILGINRKIDRGGKS